ncbi:MAG: potassium transporter [Deltaproteobacteria bacterium]|nr:potassium transporter [Candidatus Anaeroferrophillacea bacterium]
MNKLKPEKTAAARWRQRITNMSPAQTLTCYYAGAILLGTLLLASPPAARGTPLTFLDALFTATSAQCVTGLIVVDTGARLSVFGQLVVLALIQIGGLGITTFSVYLFIYLRIGVSSRGRWIINETLMHTPVSSWRELIRKIVRLTLVTEAVGAVLLAIVFVPALGFRKGLYSAVFHSVSAFCNAGFSLFSDSLTGFRANPLVNVTIMLLIVLGGIGFLVLRELLQLCPRPGRQRAPRSKCSLHSRIVLIATGFLIVVGAVLIGWLEKDNALLGMPLTERIWTALFQSVSARTAGFNTVDLNTFRAPTVFMIIFLMFVGASPGSAGGGVKTTSLALFLAIFYNRLRGNPHTTLFRRTIPDEAVTRALALVLLAIIMVSLALFGLLSVQSPDMLHEHPREFLGYTFEAFSAFGTVGLSIGATTYLTAPGKLIIILLMFVGRVGLLTMAFAIAGRPRPYAPRYAEENIMIG